ncbi:MAG TPA: hypothetical protein VEF04_14550 [Blastocatellia bacterium]|nr:hypothetical protein [Blastocatellia bacterium]
MNDIAYYLHKIKEYSQASIARLATDDSEEERIRTLYSDARYRAPHPIFSLMQLIVGLGVSANAWEVQLIRGRQETQVNASINGKMTELTTLPTELYEPLVERFIDGAGLVADRSDYRSGEFCVKWQDKNYVMPLTVTSVDAEEMLTFQIRAA